MTFITPSMLYVAVIDSIERPKAEDGTYRGARHGVFTEHVEHAAKVLARMQPGLYSVSEIGKIANVQGWAVRVAAKRLAADDETFELQSGGRGNPSRVEIHA